MKRISKSPLELMADLDDHLYLLRQDLVGLQRDDAHLKSLAAELRVLVCLSHRTEGLLWRMVDHVGASDAVDLQLAGNVDVNHPLTTGLSLAFVPIHRAGLGPPELPPASYSLKNVIKCCEAIFVTGKGITHEYLIKAIAQQIGSAHEDDAIEVPLATLKAMFINGTQPYIHILTLVSELALQVGERVITAAERKLHFKRKFRQPQDGNVSIVVRMGYWTIPTDKTMIVAFRSFIAEIELVFSLSGEQIAIDVLHRGTKKKIICLDHPASWQAKSDVVIVLSYSSRIKQIHAILNGKSQDDGIPCDIGWVHAEDFAPTNIPQGQGYPIYRQFLFTYACLLSPHQAEELLRLEPTSDGNWKSPNGSTLFNLTGEQSEGYEFPH